MTSYQKASLGSRRNILLAKYLHLAPVKFLQPELNMPYSEDYVKEKLIKELEATHCVST